MVNGDKIINISHTNIQSYRVVIGTGSALIEHRWGDIDEFAEAVRRALMSAHQIDYAMLESRFGGHIVKTLKGYLS